MVKTFYRGSLGGSLAGERCDEREPEALRIPGWRPNKIDTCNVVGYNIDMIKSFAHKGLKEFYETGSKKGIQPEHASKLARMLDRLDASVEPQDMNLPGYRLHPLKGDMEDMWSVTVNGNWRMTFYFEGQDAYLVDYMDYH